MACKVTEHPDTSERGVYLLGLGEVRRLLQHSNFIPWSQIILISHSGTETVYCSVIFNLKLLPVLLILIPSLVILFVCVCFTPNQNSGFPTSSASGWPVCESTYRDQTSCHRAASGHLHDCR